MLVESDTHDVTMCARYVWAAVLWIGKLRGWEVEDGSEKWVLDPKGLAPDENVGKKKIAKVVDEGVVIDGKIWTVRTLERNWARFMRL
jgi:hypothetical protein